MCIYVTLRERSLVAGKATVEITTLHKRESIMAGVAITLIGALRHPDVGRLPVILSHGFGSCQHGLQVGRCLLPTAAVTRTARGNIEYLVPHWLGAEAACLPAFHAAVAVGLDGIVVSGVFLQASEGVSGVGQVYLVVAAIGVERLGVEYQRERFLSVVIPMDASRLGREAVDGDEERRQAASAVEHDEAAVDEAGHIAVAVLESQIDNLLAAFQVGYIEQMHSHGRTAAVHGDFILAIIPVNQFQCAVGKVGHLVDEVGLQTGGGAVAQLEVSGVETVAETAGIDEEVAAADVALIAVAVVLVEPAGVDEVGLGGAVGLGRFVEEIRTRGTPEAGGILDVEVERVETIAQLCHIHAYLPTGGGGTVALVRIVLAVEPVLDAVHRLCRQRAVEQQHYDEKQSFHSQEKFNV